MPIKGITFDLDGTLADTLPVCYAAFRAVFRRFIGREYSDDEIHALFGPSEQGVLRNMLPDWQAALAAFHEEYEAAHDRCIEPFPGITDLLDWIDGKGIRLGIVTGKGAGSAAISLRRIGLAGRFGVIEAGSVEGAVKPQAIRKTIDGWGIEASAAMHVGDAPSDVRAARQIGVTAIAAAWAPTAKRELLEAAQPDALFDTVDSFKAWLQANR